ncbi:MAG: hypothetical protein AAGE52_06635 [Myxococcota bacterium]
MRTFFLLLALSACGAPSVTPVPRRGSAPCEDAGPHGSVAEATAVGRSVHDVEVADPRTCDGEHYIAITPAEGSLPIVMGRAESGGVRGCTEPGGDCVEVHADAFYGDVFHRFEESGLGPLRMGLGPCGDTQADYEGWNYSVAVNRWADVDAAVAIFAERLRAWDIRSTVGLSVARTRCGIELQAD